MVFYHNGSRQPVELRGFSSPVSPIVGFYSGMAKSVQLTEFATTDTSFEPFSDTSAISNADPENYNAAGGSMNARDGAPRPLQSVSAQPTPLPSLASLPLSTDRRPQDSSSSSSQRTTGNSSETDPLGGLPVVVQALGGAEDRNSLSCGYDDADYDDPRPRFRQSRCVGTTLLPCNKGRTLLRRKTTEEEGAQLHDNVYAFLSQPCTEPGIYHWKLLVESDEGASTCVGVARENSIRLADGKIMYQAQGMWLWRSFEGRIYINGLELMQKLEEFNLPGSVVGLTLDTAKGTLECELDGVSLGEPFTNLKMPLTPVIAFYGNTTKRVMLLDYNWPEKPRAERSHQCEPVDRHLPSDRCHLCATASPSHSSAATCVSSDSLLVSLQPCGHTVLCFDHAVLFVQQKAVCPQCDAQICGYLNTWE